MRRRGFTLIELLVTIGILAILATILFPVFGKAREKARQTTCLSNVKQISMAMMMYIGDWDEQFVSCTSTYRWYTPLQPYVKNGEVFHCPSMSDDEGGNGNTDYVINGLFAHSVSQADIVYPSDTVMISERKAGCPHDGYHPWPSVSSQDWDNLSDYVSGSGSNWFLDHVARERHNGGCNYGFADGHAKWLRWEQAVAEPLPGMHNPGRKVPAEYGWQ